MATTEENHAKSKMRRFWPVTLLGLSLTGLALSVAFGGDHLCGKLAPALCGRETYTLRIPLPSALPDTLHPVVDGPPEIADEPVTTPTGDAQVAETPEPDKLGTFSAQFADIADPQPAAQPTATRISRNKPARLQDVTFDLGAGADAASTIEVRKTVRVNGTDVGTLAVRIDESARLYANGSQLSALLPPDSVKPAAAADQFLSFEQLRGAGVDIRYDPTQDRLIVPGR